MSKAKDTAVVVEASKDIVVSADVETNKLAASEVNAIEQRSETLTEDAKAELEK